MPDEGVGALILSQWKGVALSLQQNKDSPDDRWACLDALADFVAVGMGRAASEPMLKPGPVVHRAAY